MATKRVAVRMYAEGGKQVKAEFQGVGASGERELGRIEKQANSTDVVLRRLFRFAAAGVSLQQLTSMANSYTQIGNSLRVLGMAEEDVSDGIARLGAIAQRTRSPLEAMASLYQRVSLASGELGASQADMLRFTENVGLALAQQGGSAQAASGALLQLSQAMGAGVVRAEEFNSILEGAFPIAQAAARGIDEAGGSVAKLRQMVIDGRVSSEMFFQAILSQSDALEDAFGRTVPTISQAFQKLRTSAILYIGQTDAMIGVSAAVARAIMFAAENVARLASHAAVAATAFGVRFVGGIVAARLATMTFAGALTFLRGALIRTGIGVLIVGAGELVFWFSRLAAGVGSFGAALKLMGDLAAEVWGRIKSGVVGVGAVLATLWYDFSADSALAMQGALEAIVGWGNNAVNTFQGAYDAIKVIWGALPAAIGDFAYQAANSLIGGVEAMLNAVVSRINSFIAGMNAALSLLPEWATGGAPLNIGLLEAVDLGRIENQFAGAATRAGAAAREAFQAAFETDAISVPDLGLEDIARAARQTADEFRGAYEDIFRGLTLPLEGWEALRQAVARSGDDAASALDEAGAAATRVEDALNNAGGAGGRAGKTIKDGADEAKTGWDALLDRVASYHRESQDIGGALGDVIVSGFKSAEQAVGDFVRTGKADVKDLVRGIIADFAQLASRRFIFGPLSNALMGALGGLSGLGAPINPFGAGHLRDFDGGGHTGYGARSGGLDGKGGMLAMVHPRERIIDETRAGGARQAAPINVHFHGVRDMETFRQSRAQIAADLGRVVAFSSRGF